MPAVSVIMPAYNVEPYLAEAIDSVLAQTFTDFELIVVNDGSTDGTAAVAARYGHRDPTRVRVVTQPNRGLAAARNTALLHARGEFVALLDSDDVWDPPFLAEQVAILRASPRIAVVTGNARYRGGPQHGLPARPYPDERPEPTLHRILADERAIFIMSVFRRRVAGAVGGFDETLRTNEDYDFWIRAARAGFGFARNDRPLGEQRRRPDSLSASDVRMLRGILRVFHKTVPSLPPGSPERTIAEQQIARFESEALAAEARQCLDRRDATGAADRLLELGRRERRPLATLGGLALRWTPSVALRAWATRQRREARGPVIAGETS